MFKFFKKEKKFSFDQKDWNAKSFSNPYFQQKKRFAFIRANKKFILLILFICAFLYFCHFIIYSDFLKIQSIKINGLQTINQISVENFIRGKISEKKFFIFPKSNALFFNEKNLEDDLINEYVLEKAEVVLENKNAINIELKEKLPTILWISNHLFYLVDSKGIVINQGIEQDKQNLVNIYDLNNESVLKGERVINDKVLSNLSYLMENIDKQTAVKFDSFRLKKDQKICDINVMTVEGVELYFDCDQSLDTQIQNLAVLLREKLKPENLKNITYIDLRLLDKIYYK